MQRAAFVSEAQSHGDPWLPPLTETLDAVAAAIETGTVLVLRLVDDGREGRLVGAVRRELRGHTVQIGRLVVAPDRQGHGFGSRLLAAAEDVPGAATAELFTGHLATANLALYARRGYVEFDRSRTSDQVVLVFLRKPLTPTPDSARPRPADSPPASPDGGGSGG